MSGVETSHAPLLTNTVLRWQAATLRARRDATRRRQTDPRRTQGTPGRLTLQALRTCDEIERTITGNQNFLRDAGRATLPGHDERLLALKGECGPRSPSAHRAQKKIECARSLQGLAVQVWYTVSQKHRRITFLFICEERQVIRWANFNSRYRGGGPCSQSWTRWPPPNQARGRPPEKSMPTVNKGSLHQIQ